MTYVPPQEILERYARLLINYAPRHGEGIRPGDVVRVMAEIEARPLADEVCKAVWRSGGHVINFGHLPGGDQSHLSPTFFAMASDEQIRWFPAKLLRGLTDEMTHELVIYSDGDPHMLDGVSPEKTVSFRRAVRPFRDWRDQKELAGEYTWTLCQYATPGLAAEAGMSVEEYWEQIIKACFLDDPDPIARWQEVDARLAHFRQRLDALQIERVHLEGQDLDLWITIGPGRRWKGGVHANIPSFELFTTPDWRGTNGWIRFSEPLYEFGSLITGIRLEFKDGVVVQATADQNEELLRQMIATPGADKLGEFSLTDGRLSRIDRFMANTLYDENVGGPYGNTHVAIGDAYQDVYPGNPAEVTDEEWERLGFNTSALHVDIVSTTDRTVTAHLPDGSAQVIYTGGQFTLD
ncbi:MAG TPA: aminopeptidase [Solirubrobacteraceae bacterium]|nr:aminopeptidase [Solirubrobacteraceae bacterium]